MTREEKNLTFFVFHAMNSKYKSLKGSRENRLPFFHAYEQKGATTHDETEGENPRGVTDADPETGCMEFDIEKGRFSFRLTAPYSEERRRAASETAKATASGFIKSMV